MKEIKNVLILLLIISLFGIVILEFCDYIKNSRMKIANTEWTVKISPLPKELNLNQKFALRIWKDILNIRLEKNKEKEVIQLYIETLAARIKTGKENFEDVLVSNKDISNKDIKKALSLLNETSPIIADMFVGNWDGRCSISELNKFINYEGTRSQVAVVKEMIRTYYRF